MASTQGPSSSSAAFPEIPSKTSKTITTTCVVTGGGPAGMVCGLLLARAGIDVTVLEKHADFLRDFRGDTLHPSTLEVMHELGLLEDLLKLPHNKAHQTAVQISGQRYEIADFSRLPLKCGFIAFMPQWEFLNFLAKAAKKYPNFHLLMRTEATDLIYDGDAIVGLHAKTPEGFAEIRAQLVVAADGRYSVLREKAKLEVENVGAPFDVLWFGISRTADDEDDTFGLLDTGKFFVMINRGDYWQVAYVIEKDSLGAVKERGLQSFRDGFAKLKPNMAERLHEIDDWDKLRLLTVRVDRLKQWYRKGCLCIGDAAHAMSPVGGVGINLAIQDAVAAANILAGPLLKKQLTVEDLAKVQKRRTTPTKLTQNLQVYIQENVIAGVLKSTRPISANMLIRLLSWWPYLRSWPGRLLGMGFQPEHVRTPEASLQ
eukprot:TRINITY_DN35816_c0_g1_i1.p1 TRINITY_DN35816_c0_g1~~TRINITY_DN35816_c0_g1_i1.p1  ORF type:complete len:429 (-),score=58.90 TRINITY_DN35816_c0_g1_i1:1781-3067(-)